jgi:hypothetical protein
LADEWSQYPNHRLMNWKIGRRPAGMSCGGDGIHSSAFKPSLQFVGKEEIGEFALTIRPSSIVSLLCIQIIKVDFFAKAFPPTADRNDTSEGGMDDVVKQETGEGKVSQVIGGEL